MTVSRFDWPVVLVFALVGCQANTPTQILVEVDTDLSIPSQVDGFRVVAMGPDGREQRSTAALGPGRVAPPRTLTLLHQEGPLTPFVVAVTAESGGAAVVTRTGTLTFEAGQARVWPVRLTPDCIGVSCGDGETCESGSCRPDAVERNELEEWDGTLPQLDAGPFDAGPPDAGEIDACLADELCNGMDDDCDGMTDEGFDTQSDPANCGACGESCTDEGVAEGTCTAGSCTIERCEEGRDNCDGVISNGCETDLTTSAAHCGGCGNACSPPNRSCCASSCARDC